MKTINDIPHGHKNKLQRPSDPYEDRVLRNQIAKANTEGDCIINVGSGYYRPVPGDEVDEKEFGVSCKRFKQGKSNTKEKTINENDI